MKKSLTSLLVKLEQSHIYESDTNISSLNDALSKSLKKGGYLSQNHSCPGTVNNSCQNFTCIASTNMDCQNSYCHT